MLTASFRSLRRAAGVLSLSLTLGLGLTVASGPAVSAPVAEKAPAADAKALVLAFVDMVFVQRQVAAAFDRYAVPDYVQHNPFVPDGAAAAVAFLSEHQRRNPKFSYDVQRVAAEGDLVFLHVHARVSPEDRGIALVDIFRVDPVRGRIVEHWDVMQAVPEKAANPHPMF